MLDDLGPVTFSAAPNSPDCCADKMEKGRLIDTALSFLEEGEGENVHNKQINEERRTRDVHEIKMTYYIMVNHQSKLLCQNNG